MFCTLLGASHEFSPSALIAFQSGGVAGLRVDCVQELSDFVVSPLLASSLGSLCTVWQQTGLVHVAHAALAPSSLAQ